jgi:hypothetical protein
MAAHADDSPVLSAEQPTADSQPIAPAQQPAVPEPAAPPSSGEHKTVLLNGEVKKQGAQLGDSQYNLQANDTGANLQPETGAATATPPFKLALEKLAHNQPLTAEEYRSLNIGVIGMDSTRTFFQDEGVIDASYPGMPAYEAGIRVGDHEIFDNVDDSKVKDPTRPTWMFSCGVAGETMDVTIRHGKDIQTYHVTEMNMEDIPDPKLRKTYEKLVQKLGSQPGSYTFDSDPRTQTPKAVSLLKLLMKI